ncbi:MAG: HAMP domain-containing protein [Alphaproteobacteria bacterium]|uniref:histidine kinase n=1 Tax=Candidatus Nitrobium versatile TaxID=2884831 RepID=A0A953J9W4_9BACT|nr:HAMP domain-containing protein [Candidatus Nitrobium versatile]
MKKLKVAKHLALVFGMLLLVVLITVVELYFIKLPSVDLTTRLLLTALLTLNILALLTLIFFVSKNLLRLYTERRHRVLGYRFRTKLMAIFVILTLIPSSFLFIAASGLATNYIEKIFSPQMREPFDKSVELAQAFYDLGRERVLMAAEHAAAGKQPFLPGMTVERYTAVPETATDIVREAFSGKKGTEVISGSNGDIIRAAVPNRVKGGSGAVVVELVLSKKISENSERLKELYEDYVKLESFKNPLSLNYILTLGFLTLLMVFAALWVSLKISRGITTPIQSLAMATEQVASGNLNVQVTVRSEDEIGMLIDSFNQMVRQLKDSNDSLEKAYRESDRRRLYLENILENINSGVFFLAGTGEIMTINRAACSILNAKQEDIIGKDYREFIAGLQSEDLVQLVKEMEGKEIREIKREVKVSINGRIALIRIYIAGIRESYTAKSLGMLVVFDDLTDIIKAQKATAWQEVARRLAHEIKNPLTPIKLSTERLIKKWQNRDEDFDTVFEKSTRTIISEVESLRKLVDVFSRYGKMPEINKAPTSLPELLDSAIGLYKGFKDVDIQVAVQEGIDRVTLDSEQFKRVFVNIIDNAIKAMNGKGVITISVKSPGPGKIVVDFADTGPGIRDEEKEKLFLPYFSGRKGGTGLGLAIANKIVADHEGRILVRDNTPRGSVFTVEIPG